MVLVEVGAVAALERRSFTNEESGQHFTKHCNVFRPRTMTRSTQSARNERTRYSSSKILTKSTAKVW